jgi:hypothetical protein
MNTRFSIPTLHLLAFGGLAALFVGCVSTPLRTEASTSEISAAEAVGAASVPQASLHLALAKEALERAKAYAAHDEPEKAASMLMRAEVDAELAVALSREDTERKQAQEAFDRVKKLRANNPGANNSNPSINSAQTP